MTPRLLTLVLLVLAGPAAAAPEAPAAGPGTPPGSGPGAAAPGPEAAPLDPKRNNAAKLAGLVRFVTESCPEQRADMERFKGAVRALGVPLEDLSQGELLLRATGYVQAYQKDPAESCRKATAHFGAEGTTIPGLVLPKETGAPKAP